MTENHEYIGHEGETRPAPSWLTDILTPEASAIAGFAFAALSLLGQGTVGLALEAITFGASYGPDHVGAVYSLLAVGNLVLAALALLLSRRTLRAESGPAPWTGHLARAATIVAAAGVVACLIAIVGGLVTG
ncbi:MAG TPA: hypothetical protein VFJ19_05135 [Nocardioidaceae bacterium]|nr:hypothetical protein [Nocardioidaceae bacterium]